MTYESAVGKRDVPARASHHVPHPEETALGSSLADPTFSPGGRGRTRCAPFAPGRALCSGLDQQTIPDQLDRLRAYVAARGWTVAIEVSEVASGADVARPQRQDLLAAARRREVDVILVVRLDRWGRDLADLVTTLRDLADLGVGFVSLAEAIDLTTSVGRALVGLLSVFAAFERDRTRERIMEEIARRKAAGLPTGRPPQLEARHGAEVHRLAAEMTERGIMSIRAIAARVGISRASVRRLLARPDRSGESSGTA